MSQPYRTETKTTGKFNLHWSYFVIPVITLAIGVLFGYQLQSTGNTANRSEFISGSRCDIEECFSGVPAIYSSLKSVTRLEASDNIANYRQMMERLGILLNPITPTNAGTDLSRYFYIAKGDLLKMFCDQCAQIDPDQTNGVIIQFGLLGDNNRPADCVLRPYIRPVYFNGTTVKVQNDEYYYADWGCPENCGGENDTSENYSSVISVKRLYQ